MIKDIVLTPENLSYLLKTNKEQAQGFIEYTNLKLGKHSLPTECTVAEIDKVKDLGIEFMIANIQKSYLTNSTTKAYIMDLPGKKIESKLQKGESIPRSISIPRSLKCFLTEEQVEEIHKLRSKTYARFGDIKWN